MQKFAPDSDSHLFGEEIEDSLKKAKGRHYSLQALKQSTQAHKRKPNADMPSSKSKSYRPAKTPWTDQKRSPQTNKQHLAPKHDSHIRKDHRRSQELRKHIDLQINQIESHDKFLLHEEVKNSQAGNISKHVKAWEKSQQTVIP